MPYPVNTGRWRSKADPYWIEQAIVGVAMLRELNLPERHEVVRRLVRAGHSNPQIAAHLKTTTRSVERWRSRIREGVACRWSPIC